MTGLELFLFFVLSAGIGNHAQTVHQIHQEQGVPTATVRTGGRLTLYKRDDYKPVPLKQVFAKMAEEQRYWNDLARQSDGKGNYGYLMTLRRKGIYVPQADIDAAQEVSK